jgi:hypothetical protein
LTTRKVVGVFVRFFRAPLNGGMSAISTAAPHVSEDKQVLSDRRHCCNQVNRLIIQQVISSSTVSLGPVPHRGPSRPILIRHRELYTVRVPSCAHTAHPEVDTDMN